MSAVQIINLVLWLLQGVAAYTKKTADDKILAEIRRAIEALERVRGSLVTKEQLEGLRTEVKWPEV